MFATCETPRSRSCSSNRGDAAFLYWHFVFGARRPSTPRDGRRVCNSTPPAYASTWFSGTRARQLYEDIPVLGTLLRALRRRLAARIAGAANHLDDTGHPT